MKVTVTTLEIILGHFGRVNVLLLWYEKVLKVLITCLDKNQYLRNWFSTMTFNFHLGGQREFNICSWSTRSVAKLNFFEKSLFPSISITWFINHYSFSFLFCFYKVASID